MENAQDVSTSPDPNVKIYPDEDWGEIEQNVIKGY